MAYNVEREAQKHLKKEKKIKFINRYMLFKIIIFFIIFQLIVLTCGYYVGLKKGANKTINLGEHVVVIKSDIDGEEFSDIVQKYIKYFPVDFYMALERNKGEFNPIDIVNKYESDTIK